MPSWTFTALNRIGITQALESKSKALIVLGGKVESINLATPSKVTVAIGGKTYSATLYRNSIYLSHYAESFPLNIGEASDFSVILGNTGDPYNIPIPATYSGAIIVSIRGEPFDVEVAPASQFAVAIGGAGYSLPSPQSPSRELLIVGGNSSSIDIPQSVSRFALRVGGRSISGIPPGTPGSSRLSLAGLAKSVGQSFPALVVSQSLQSFSVDKSDGRSGVFLSGEAQSVTYSSLGNVAIVISSTVPSQATPQTLGKAYVLIAGISGSNMGSRSDPGKTGVTLSASSTPKTGDRRITASSASVIAGQSKIPVQLSLDMSSPYTLGAE